MYVSAGCDNGNAMLYYFNDDECEDFVADGDYLMQLGCYTDCEDHSEESDDSDDDCDSGVYQEIYCDDVGAAWVKYNCASDNGDTTCGDCEGVGSFEDIIGAKDGTELEHCYEAEDSDMYVMYGCYWSDSLDAY